MARTKRALDEIDANIEAAPLSKKISSKRDGLSQVMSKAEFEALFPSKAPTSTPSTSSTDDEARVALNADLRTWICICHLRNNSCGLRNKKCICGRYADANTNETSIVTLKGFNLHKGWGLEQYERDQDNFRMHIFNDWSGYGTCEVMENMFLAFNKEAKKKTKDIWAMWPTIEGMAFFLNRTADLGHWYGLGDSEGNAKRVMLFGTALLTTIDVLINEKLFKSKDTEIRNIALILGHFLKFAPEMTEMCSANEDGWKKIVLERVDEYGMKSDLLNINHIISEIENAIEDDDTTSSEDDFPKPKRLTKSKRLQNAATSYESKPWAGLINLESLEAGTKRSWAHWDWATELTAYSKAQAVKVGPIGPIYGKRIGGRFYDLTAKANQRRLRHFRLGPEEREEDSE